MVWIPVMAGLVVTEVVSAPFGDRPHGMMLVVVTAVAGAAVIFAALALSRDWSGRTPFVAVALIDAAAVATGLLSPAGNDAAILLPYLAAVLLLGELDERELVAAFTIQWLIGMVGATAAFGFSDLRSVPDADPIAVSLAASAVMSFIGYTLLWWVRQRLDRALRSAQAAEEAAHGSEQALAALIRGSPVPTIGFDLAGIIQTWNPGRDRLRLAQR